MKSITVAVLAISLSILAGLSTNADPLESETQTAMGLTFGQTFQQAQAAGLQAAQLNADDDLITYNVTKFPIHPSSTDTAVVVFDDSYGLQKLVWHSKTIDGDISGSLGKEQYNSIKLTLTKKYGRPSNTFERIGLKLYREFDEFYQCLDYAGCGAWTTIWQGDSGGAMLEIKSGGLRGQGWLKVTYEGPKWSEIVEALESKTRTEDSKAF